MKRMDIFCASQTSTAICMSMDQPSSSAAASSSLSSSAIQLGGRHIDRHNPIIRDQRRTPRVLPLTPCTTKTPPINPQPYHLLHKSKTSSSTINSDQTKKSKSSGKQNNIITRKDKKCSANNKLLAAAAAGGDGGDGGGGEDSKNYSFSSSTDGAKNVVFQRKSWAQPGDFITPPGSSRYLLGDKDYFDGLSDYNNDPVLALVNPSESKRFPQFSTNQLQEESTSSSKPSSTSDDSSEKPSNQVVVLRVSLHCRGCEGKVRKHLSRMEGVSSFSIDFAAKKVTIVGDVTPLGVLASVSKVKSAQFWTPANNSAAVPSINSQLKK